MLPCAESISALISNASAFNGKHVVVTGAVSDVRMKSSRRGNDYETFSLCESACVHVFTCGHPSIVGGRRLTIHGAFAAVKHVGCYTFRDEIEADDDSL